MLILYFTLLPVAIVAGLALILFADYKQAMRLKGINDQIAAEPGYLNPERRAFIMQVLSAISRAGPFTVREARKLKTAVKAENG